MDVGCNISFKTSYWYFVQPIAPLNRDHKPFQYHLLEHQIPRTDPYRIVQIRRTNQTFRQIGLAAILSSSTSALGFYTLSLSPINPVGSFGQFAAIGICISCILTITILYLFFQSSFQNNSNSIINTSRFWHRILDKTFTNLLKFRITVITTHLIALTTAIYFMSKVEVNGSLIGEIPKHHPILADKDFMEREFGGMRSF